MLRGHRLQIAKRVVRSDDTERQVIETKKKEHLKDQCMRELTPLLCQ